VSSRRPEETRAAILDAARGLFETHGFHAVGLEAVAKRAGVSRQAIYLHFDSKQALLDALHLHVNAQDVEPEMRKVWVAPDALAGLDAFVAATAAAVPRFLRIFQALESASRVETVAATTFEPPRTGRRADCLRMATWLDDEGLLAPGLKRRDAGDILYNLASVWSYESLVVVCGWSPRRWTAWTRDALKTALLADPDEDS
jgi:AcrR family transcriptional regulator